jgi:hypothetical protein
LPSQPWYACKIHCSWGRQTVQIISHCNSIIKIMPNSPPIHFVSRPHTQERFALQTFFKKPSLCASLFSASSPSPIPRTKPQRAYTWVSPVARPFSSTNFSHVSLSPLSPRVVLYEVRYTLCDADLHRSVVLCLDDAVRGRALAWDVEVDELTACEAISMTFMSPEHSQLIRSFSMSVNLQRLWRNRVLLRALVVECRY